MVSERVFFKHNHYLYLARDFKDGTIELWAVAARKPYEWELHEYSLGKYILKDWIKPKGFYNYQYSMQRSAQKLFAIIVKEREDDKKEIPTPKAKKENKMWTREDFVEAGRRGQAKVKEKYRVESVVNLRWGKTKTG